jgi:ACS family hexuronate transporter-like MFS transporter
MGVINAGTAVGAVIAPPAIAAIITMGGWRWVFVIAGGVGLLWAAYWLMAVKEAPQQESEPPVAWLPLLRCKEIWALIVAKFLSDAAWYFYLFWLPKYLYDVRGFDTKRVGYYAWIPYAASGIGSLAGGWFSSWLLRQGCSVNKARKIALGASAAVMPIIFLVDSAPVDLAIAIFSVAFFGQQSWSTLVMALPTDLVTGRAVGSVAGLVGFGGAMGGVVFGLVVGFVLDHGYGYGPVFAMAGIFHVLAFSLILLVIPVIKRVELK